MADTRGRALAVFVGMHAERLEAPMVENRDHDVAALGQRPADLDLPVLSVKATAQLEDPPRAGRATSDNLRTLTQLTVGRLRAPALRFDPSDKERRHLRRPLDGLGG